MDVIPKYVEYKNYKLKDFLLIPSKTSFHLFYKGCNVGYVQGSTKHYHKPEIRAFLIKSFRERLSRGYLIIEYTKNNWKLTKVELKYVPEKIINRRVLLTEKTKCIVGA